MAVRALADARRTRVVDPDAELVAAARAHPGEFLALYDRYFDRVLGYVRLRIRDSAACEDVTSHVFTTALEQIGRFRGDGRFAGWLFQIARNAVRDVQRQRATEPFVEDQAAVGATPEERILERERAEELHALNRLLRPEQQHLLALRYGAGLAFDEIGAILDSAPATIRVRMHRILEELRQRYPHDRRDELNQRMLERHLEKLAEPREEDERVRLAIRAHLAADLRPQPRPRRRVPRSSWRRSWGRRDLAVQRSRVRPSFTTRSMRLPRRRTRSCTSRSSARRTVAIAAETWQQISPPYASRGLKGEAARQGEFGDNGTNSVQYDPRTNTIDEQPDSSSPTFTDPVSQIREELAAGQAQNVGTVELDGHRLYKIDLPRGLVGYFDQNDYQPRYLDDPQGDGSVVRLRVVAYEYLPMTPSNRALLSVTAQHPAARIDTNPHAGTGK